MVYGSLFATLISACVAAGDVSRDLARVAVLLLAVGVLWTLGAMGWANQQVGLLGRSFPRLSRYGLVMRSIFCANATAAVADNTRDQAILLMLRRTGPACHRHHHRSHRVRIIGRFADGRAAVWSLCGVGIVVCIAG